MHKLGAQNGNAGKTSGWHTLYQAPGTTWPSESDDCMIVPKQSSGQSFDTALNGRHYEFSKKDTKPIYIRASKFQEAAALTTNRVETDARTDPVTSTPLVKTEPDTSPPPKGVAKNIHSWRMKPYQRPKTAPDGLFQHPVGLSATNVRTQRSPVTGRQFSSGEELARLVIQDNRHLVLRSYQGTLYCCIRDYFQNPENPSEYIAGKRGINLLVPQYLKLKELMSEFDQLLVDAGVSLE